MEEEITGLRLLNRSLLEMQKYTTEPAEAGLLAEAYTRSSARLAQMIQIEEEMNKRRPEEDWPHQLIASLAEGAWERGEEFDIELEKERALGGGDGLAANARRLAEETAGMRVVLRRTFRLAIESEEVHRCVYLTEVYSRGCSRLVKLLALEGDGQTRP
jgi:hypothetical protein